MARVQDNVPLNGSDTNGGHSLGGLIVAAQGELYDTNGSGGASPSRPSDDPPPPGASHGEPLPSIAPSDAKRLARFY